MDPPAPGDARLVLFDLLGREVRVALDAELAAGRHRVELSLNGLAAGVYLVRMTTGSFTQTQKLVMRR